MVSRLPTSDSGLVLANCRVCGRKKDKEDSLQPQLRVGTSAPWLHPWVWARPPQFQSLRKRAVALVGKTLKITSPWGRRGGEEWEEGVPSICRKALEYPARRSFQLWFISAFFVSHFKMGLFTHLFYLHLWLLHSRELHLIYCLGLGLLRALDISQNRSILKPRQDRKEIQKNFRASWTSRDYPSRQPGWQDPLWMEDDDNSHQSADGSLLPNLDWLQFLRLGHS